MTQYSFPFGIDGRGLTAFVSQSDQMKHLVRQIPFTTLGEKMRSG